MIRLRYAGTCVACGTTLSKGTEACYDRLARATSCVTCPAEAEPEPLDLGVAGASARRIAERQQAKREREKQRHDDATRDAHPRVGNLMVRVRDALAEPEKPTSWQKGAVGEEAVGRTFAALADEGFVVLHDRRKPGTKWNIDHIVVGPRGVYVIDAKHYSGRLEVRPTGSLLRPGPGRVFVGGRSQDKRVKGMDWQFGCVRDAVGTLVSSHGGAIRPVLCFLGVELGWTQKAVVAGTNEVIITWPRQFVKDIGRDGPLVRSAIDEVARQLAEALPAAVR